MNGNRLVGWMLGALLMVSPGLARASLFALVDGIPGSSTEVGHSQWLSVDSISWGLERAGAAPAFQPVTLTFESGSWSAALAQSAATGRPVARVILDRTAVFADGQKIVSRYVLEDVIVRSFEASGSGGNGRESNQVQLAFTTIKWENYSYGSNGTLQSASKGGWSLKSNGPL